jgi:dynein heavy chain 2
LKKSIPALKACKGEAMTPDHWAQLFKILGIRGMTLEKLALKDLVEQTSNLLANEQQIKDLNARALGEVVIREALQELQMWGANAMLSLTEHKSEKRSTPMIKEWEELLTQVGDNQSLVGSLKDSPYFGPFQDDALKWETRLSDLSDFLQLMNQIQRKWVYLEPIFGRGSLPSETSRFNRVDEEFRTIMLDLNADPKVLTLLAIHGLKERLPHMLDQLERCQKALAEFLEGKRGRFPRFYFIGDDDLLEILGQCKNPAVIQSHLKKLFQGIFRVEFGEKDATLIAMCDIYGENVPLDIAVKISDQVEEWLVQLANRMVSSLQAMLLSCLAQTDLAKYPGQLLSVSEMLHFTARAEKALQSHGLDKLGLELAEELQKYTAFNASSDSVLRLKMYGLILDMVHNREVVDMLREAGVTSLGDWQWQKQLRYYMNKEKKVAELRMVSAEMAYSYEYQGNAPRLVQTPLTDKCYLTLTQAMQLGYGGNPYGPAGTGKTESVKALGQVLGRQVLVFNCDEGIDFKSMGRIFTGLVKCGAWGCFDEFNRLEEDVLSAVSQQIQTIQVALKLREKTVTIIGDTPVDVDHNSGIFVTLNPAGKGYGGRSKLPDNLKQLFRAVAMSKPDNERIAEVTLYAGGFEHAAEGGRKLVAVFRLSQQLLSWQQHYDWGLRAIKTVLFTASSLIQARKAANGNKSIPKEEEFKLLIQARRIHLWQRLAVIMTCTFAGDTREHFGQVGISR